MNRRRPLGIALPLVIGLLLTGCLGCRFTEHRRGERRHRRDHRPGAAGTTGLGSHRHRHHGDETEVVHVDLAAVRSISADGATMTMSKSAAEKMQPGSLFVIDGVASRKVTGVAAAGDGATVQTEQATPDEIFADLDVSFQGSPSLDQAVVGGPAVAAPGADPALSSTGPAAATGDRGQFGSAEQTRSAGAALACKARTASIILNADPITVTPSITTNADCTGFTFTADVTASSGPVSAGIVLKGGLTILNMSGHLSAGSSGSSQSAGAQINGNIDVSGKAAAQEPGGWVRRYKMTWDALKVDYPVVIDGVPFVFRFGIPLILELRFSGNHDTVVGQYIGLQCKGLLNVGSDADSTAADICTMARRSSTRSPASRRPGWCSRPGSKSVSARASWWAKRRWPLPASSPPERVGRRHHHRGDLGRPAGLHPDGPVGPAQRRSRSQPGRARRLGQPHRPAEERHQLPGLALSQIPDRGTRSAAGAVVWWRPRS